MKTKNISLALFFVLIAIFLAPLQISWSADDDSVESKDLLMIDLSSSDNQDDLDLLESIVLVITSSEHAVREPIVMPLVAKKKQILNFLPTN